VPITTTCAPDVLSSPTIWSESWADRRVGDIALRGDAALTTLVFALFRFAILVAVMQSGSQSNP